jgi:hypothetical protein
MLKIAAVFLALAFVGLVSFASQPEPQIVSSPPAVAPPVALQQQAPPIAQQQAAGVACYLPGGGVIPLQLGAAYANTWSGAAGGITCHVYRVSPLGVADPNGAAWFGFVQYPDKVGMGWGTVLGPTPALIGHFADRSSPTERVSFTVR